MNEKIIEIEKIDLDGTEDGQITIATVSEPYGTNSQSIVSIGISLQSTSKEPDWKVHIPKANIDNVIAALQEAKKTL